MPKPMNKRQRHNSLDLYTTTGIKKKPLYASAPENSADEYTQSHGENALNSQ
jgi:hypothetical protein